MSKKLFLLLVLTMAFCLSPVMRIEARIAQEAPDQKVINAIFEREREMVESLTQYSPIVETYMQHFSPDKELGAVPTSDEYFLTKLAAGPEWKGYSMTESKGGLLSRIASTLTSVYSIKYDRMGLVEMILINEDGFDEEKDHLQFVQKEFLGDVRCLVFDVRTKASNRFTGRIWVEDEGYNVVRFNGVKGNSGGSKIYFHQDSWRQNLGGRWLPVYVYSEETDLRSLTGKVNFKAQTRLWGYNLGRPQQEDERTSLVVESDKIRDNNSDLRTDSSPVLGTRSWERQAEDNVLNRMQKAGLLAPNNDVDAVLETVVSNIEVTNDLALDPPLRARVLLTSPMESFTIGRTIVLSRGLIDVLPDEASLAMVLAHEVAHIVLNHQLDTKYAFHDRMQFDDQKAFSRLSVKRSESEEKEADAKALELLSKSPYADKLGSAGLFLRAVQRSAKKLPNLLKAHMGNRIAEGKETVRMSTLANQAPKLELGRVDQIAALPLGGRVRLDPWSATIQLVKSAPVSLRGPREKMQFEITPLFPHLTRQTTSPSALASTDTESAKAGGSVD
jgi:hypothetical protein